MEKRYSICFRLLMGVMVLAWCGSPGQAQQPAAPPQPVMVLNLEGSINPGAAEFVQNGVTRAEGENAACLVIVLDTPGGLAASMRQMVKTIWAATMPVVVYVAPSGARAASAGVMITLAADVAAMAPGTHMGAAHPVAMGGEKMDDTIAAKVTNDMAAYARSVAERRGRNGEWAEQAVRESISATEKEALETGVIDLIASDLDDLIRQIDQREIPGKGVLALKEAPVIAIKEDLRSKVLRVIADPNVAFILFMLGLAGLYFELSHPGTIFPGVVGAIALVLAFFAFQTLPINFTGMLLIGLALIFFILELKITSYGLLSIAGIVALVLGSLMLFKGAEEGIRPSLKVILPTVVIVTGFFVGVAGLVYKAQVRRPWTGREGLVGEIGVARTAIDPQGKVFVHGELWRATADAPIPAGTSVEVKAVHNLTLVVVAKKDV